MDIFECQSCGNTVYFSDTVCVVCQHQLGYLHDRFLVTALQPGEREGSLVAAADGQSYVRCANSQYGSCNWLVTDGSGDTLCRACRPNRTVPDLTEPDNLVRWRRVELAKHQLIYSLMRWRLPIPDRSESDPLGLTFDFVSDVVKPDGSVEPVTTGHADGLITINIAEADDAERERRRSSMGEPYRTLLGHFRHEIGHYYWNLLVRDTGRLDAFRATFGDERRDYGQALSAYYEQGAPADWQGSFISAYATAHPWEDFAETWAHYMHIVDALETVDAFGIRIRPRVRSEDLEVSSRIPSYQADSVEALVDNWVPVTIAVNSINRSMGVPDLYPFVLSQPVVEKLRFVHEAIHATGRAGSGRNPT